MGLTIFRILSLICCLACLGLAGLISGSLYLAPASNTMTIAVSLTVSLVFVLGAVWLFGIYRHVQRARVLLDLSEDPTNDPFQRWLTSLRAYLSWAFLGLSLFLAALLFGVLDRVAGGDAVFG
jgi:hypothetical protein